MNYLNNDYLGISNLNNIYADTGNIDTFSCKSLTIGGTDYTSYNNNLQNQINQKLNISDYGNFNGDVILNQSNTYLSGDTSNFTIKNKYPIYTLNPLIINSNLLYLYTFNVNDILGNTLKNQANNQYDLLIESNVIIDGTLNIPFLTSDTVSSKITSSFSFGNNFCIGSWIRIENVLGSYILYCSNNNNQVDCLKIYYNNSGTIQLEIINSNVQTIQNTGFIIPINTWCFFTFAVIGTTWVFYFNGLKETYLNKVNINVKLMKFNFIGKFLTNILNLNGKMDNFFIYNNILSDTEINDIFNAGQNPSINAYYTIPIQPYTYTTTYGYKNILSLDNNGNISNNPSITNLQTIDTSLQTQINNIISSSATDIKTIIIGTTTTLDSGDNASVVNVGTSQNMILNFSIPRGYRGFSGSDGSKGDKGDTGDTGEKGDRGSDGSSVGIETVVGIIEGIFTQLEIAGLQAQITALAGQITLIIVRLEVLEAKTIFQSIIGNNTRFTSNLAINNGVSDRINLNQDGTITSYGKLLCNADIEGAKLISNSDIQGNRLMSSGDITGSRLLINDINSIETNTTNMHGLNINIGDLNALSIPTTLTSNINGSIINIGASSAGIINIGGGGATLINLNGIVNTYGVFGFQSINGYFTQFQ